MSGYFGLSSGSFDYDQLEGGPNAAKFTNTVGNGRITKIEMLVNDSSPNGNIKMGIYSDNSGDPDSLLLDCGETAVVNGFTVISGLNLEVTLNTVYWLTLVLENENTLRYDDGASHQAEYYTKAYGDLWEDPWPAATELSDVYCMRAFVELDYSMPASTASFSLTGVASNFLYIYLLLAVKSTYTFTANTINLVRGFLFPISIGSFSFSGSSILFSYAKGIAASVASFSLTGINTTLLTARNITASTVSFLLSGKTLNLLKGFLLQVIKVTFILSGITALFSFGYKVALSTISFALTGITTTFSRTRAIVITVSEYILIGITSSFTISRNDPGYNPLISFKREDRKFPFKNILDRIAKKFKREERQFGEDKE